MEVIYHPMIIISLEIFKLESPVKIRSPPTSIKCPLTILRYNLNIVRLLEKVYQEYMVLLKALLLMIKTFKFNSTHLSKNILKLVVDKITIIPSFVLHNQSKIIFSTRQNNQPKSTKMFR
jgi:hypothetical protein